MKKIVFYFFLLLFLFIFNLHPPSILAFEEFKKVDKNPLPFNFSSEYKSIFQGDIRWENSYFRGIFSSINQNDNVNNFLSYAESTDGINWEIKKKILELNQEIHAPRFFVINNQVYLYFSLVENGVYKIFYTTCDTDFNCRQEKNLILSPSFNWDYNGVFSPFIYFDGSFYYLFYGSWGNQFQIALATSTDGQNWQRCLNPIISDFDAPFVIKYQKKLYLFAHAANASGIKVFPINNLSQCDVVLDTSEYVLSPSQSYDQSHIIFPSLIEKDSLLHLYYTGLGITGWRLNLAKTERVPVVIIPGFMASWNKNAILYNQPVSVFDWKILSFVKEYDGLTNTLKLLNYQENQDFFVFPYDWRKPVEETTNDLNTFLQQKIWNNNPNQKINLIGHSLGGLIGRIFTQKNKNKVNKIISVGSPHQGVVQVYKPLAAGEIDRENTFLWLAQKLVLILNKSNLETDRETVQKYLPVAFDLFPTFNFLKDENGNEIPINNLTIKNNLLQTYQQNFSDIFPLFTSIYGEKENQTPAGFIVEPANFLNQILGNYKDGQPKTIFYDVGDYTVLSKSTRQDDDAEKLTLDHGEIITKSEAIKKILSLLNIDYQESQIVEGQKTTISPSLIFIIKSPATMTVKFNNQIYQEEDGLIFIPNSQPGNYTLEVQGRALGKYIIHIGQIAATNDIWEKIEGEIIQSPPSSQIDSYSINYNNQTAFSIFPTPTLTPTTTLTITPTSISTPTIINIPTPTATPTPIFTPTFTPDPTSTVTPTITPTPINSPATSSTQTLSSTNSSLNNQNISPTPTLQLVSFLAQKSSPQILGIQEENRKEEETTEEKNAEKNNQKTTKKSSILDFIFPPVIALLIGGVSYFFKKKFFQ